MFGAFRVVSALLYAVVALAILAGADWSLAQATEQAPVVTLPSDDQLDALLAARDWNALGSALAAATHDQPSFRRGMAWLQSRIDSGGGSLLGFIYIKDLWGVGNTLKIDDPNKDGRLTAGMMWLYTYELIAIDGAKCQDRTAPAHRVEQLISMEPDKSVLVYLKAKPAEIKAQVVDIAIALEQRTAPLRKEDDLICRGGIDEMSAGIEAGKTHEIPTPPGQVGKTVAVEAPPGYAPKFLPAETYKPLQEKARLAMRPALLKLVE